jgi:hypothetical protein
MPVIMAASLAVLVLAPTGAEAAKEKFERTKPHVNVSTVQVQGESLSLVVSLLEPQALVDPDRDPPGESPCSANYELRILDAGRAGGPPLAEQSAASPPAGTAHVFRWDSPRGAGPMPVHAVLVVRDADGIDGKTCILRGSLELRDPATGQASATLPLRLDDSVAVGSGRFGW